MKTRRVAYIVESHRDGQWGPVAAWWTRELAREDVRERNGQTCCPDKLRIIDYRPLDGWGVR